MLPTSIRSRVLAIVFVAGCATTTTDELSVTSAAITDPVPAAAGRHDLRFDVSNGDQRAYILRLPAGYDPLRPDPYPVVFLFHGAGQSASSFYGRPGMSRMRTLADAQGKILIFAQGTLGTSVVAAGTWDDSGLVKDDLLYAEDLLDYVLPNLNADATRVLAAGFSMGGHFVHFLGATSPTRYRAIGVVEGFYGSNAGQPAAPAPGTLLPVFIVHGDADTTVPIGGGAAAGFTSARAAYDAWYLNDTCTAFSALPLHPPPTHTFVFTSCKPGTSGNVVRFTTVFGLGHLWPVAANGFDASARLLDFFDQQ